MSGDLLTLDSLKRSQNAVLSDVVEGDFLDNLFDHVLRQSRWQILRHVVALVVGVGTGLAALHRNAPAIIRAGQGKSK